MSATFQDIAVYSTSTPATPISVSHAVTAGDDQKLIVFAVVEGGTLSDIATPTYNGVAMTKVDVQVGGTSGIIVGQYCLDSPPVGAHTLAVDLSAGAPSRAALRVFTACGLAAGAATAFNGSGASSSTSSTVSVASVPANSVILDGVSGNLHTTASMSPTESAQTAIASGPIAISADGVIFGVSARPAASSGSWAMSWSFASSQTRIAHTAGAYALSAAVQHTSDYDGTFTIDASEWSVTFTAPDADSHWQAVAGVADVPVGGTYTGPVEPSGFEGKIVLASDGVTVVQDWTPCTAVSAASGVWSAKLAAPEGDVAYKMYVRIMNGATAEATTAVTATAFYSGDIILLLGSSTARNWVTEGVGSPHAAIKMRAVSGGGWTTLTGGPAIQLANAVRAARGVAVGVLHCGEGGTFLQDNWENESGNFADVITLLNEVGNKVAFALCHVGSNDARTGTIDSKAGFLASWRSLIANTRTRTGVAALPFFIWGCQRSASGTAANWNIAREVESELSGDANVYLATTVVDLPLAGDLTHLTPAAMLTAMSRAQLAVFDVTGSGTYHRGAKITAFEWSGSSCAVTVQHYGGSDLTPSSGITGFTASDGSGALTVSAAVRTSAQLITLTFNRAVVAPLDVRYQSGGDPVVTAPAFDNSGGVLPMQPETLLAATEAGAQHTSDYDGTFVIDAPPHTSDFDGTFVINAPPHTSDFDGTFLIAGSAALPALVLVDGVVQVIAEAQIGTGLKPLVLDGDRWRQRQAAEGTPIVLDAATRQCRLLGPTETIEV